MVHSCFQGYFGRFSKHSIAHWKQPSRQQELKRFSWNPLLVPGCSACPQGKTLQGTFLVAHLTAIGDTISAIPPYSAIPPRGQLELRYPLPPPPLGCDRANLGGYSAIPCVGSAQKAPSKRAPSEFTWILLEFPESLQFYWNFTWISLEFYLNFTWILITYLNLIFSRCPSGGCPLGSSNCDTWKTQVR